MINRAWISRRTVLRGLGVSLALPALEAMSPLVSYAGAAEAKKAPVRVTWIYVPNGIHMQEWTPKEEGASYALTPILKPLESLKSDFLILTGLTADKARPHGDGGGDHARALSAFLTGCQPRKTDGTDIRVGISADQVAAGRVGHLTRLPSLEIGCDRGGLAGNCDSGYSCAYSSTMSWRSATTPVPKEVNPKLIFERLFSTTPDAERAKRDARRKSILDFVQEDAGSLKNQLGATDQSKLEEYFSSIRDIEQRIDRAAKLPPVQAPDIKLPANVPNDYQEHIRLLADLVVLAFQTDSTRVCTFVFANEGSNRPYPFIGVSEGHHDLSHHENNPAKQKKISQINTFHTSQLAYLLGKLKDVKEGAGTLLDNCLIAYGSGNSDGNAHNHDNLPILLAGKGGGTVKPGRHIRYAKETPVNNLWLAMLDRVGGHVDQLGDSTGQLAGLEG
jgi:hypothetical protein